MPSLRQYLTKIQRREPINYDQFLNVLPTSYRHNSKQLFQIKFASNKKTKKYLVTCDESTFNELWQASEPVTDRVQSTLLGDSHKHRVSANLLMVYHREIASSLCPDVIYVSASDILQHFKSQKRLLLVENEENFIQYGAFIDTLSRLTAHQIDIEDTDIALGGGNRASSQFLMKVYAQYDEILCAFDYDLGGLKTFRSIQATLGDKVHFVQPSNYSIVATLFKKSPGSDTKLLDTIDMANSLGFCELADIFKKTRHFMEQESLLAETNV